MFEFMSTSQITAFFLGIVFSCIAVATSILATKYAKNNLSFAKHMMLLLAAPFIALISWFYLALSFAPAFFGKELITLLISALLALVVAVVVVFVAKALNNKYPASNEDSIDNIEEDTASVEEETVAPTLAIAHTIAQEKEIEEIQEVCEDNIVSSVEITADIEESAQEIAEEIEEQPVEDLVEEQVEEVKEPAEESVEEESENDEEIAEDVEEIEENNEDDTSIQEAEAELAKLIEEISNQPEQSIEEVAEEVIEEPVEEEIQETEVVDEALETNEELTETTEDVQESEIETAEEMQDNQAESDEDDVNFEVAETLEEQAIIDNDEKLEFPTDDNDDDVMTEADFDALLEKLGKEVEENKETTNDTDSDDDDTDSDDDDLTDDEAEFEKFLEALRKRRETDDNDDQN